MLPAQKEAKFIDELNEYKWLCHTLYVDMIVTIKRPQEKNNKNIQKGSQAQAQSFCASSVGAGGEHYTGLIWIGPRATLEAAKRELGPEGHLSTGPAGLRGR